jgi:hypothetical protein
VEVTDKWPKPEPIQCEIPSVQACCKDLLPDSFRALVADVAERMQIPRDYPAVVIVLSLAGAVNRRAVILRKAHDTGWAIVPNLFGGIIAPLGFMRSPVIQAATRPLNRVQTEWRLEHGAALKEYACQKEESELRGAVWKEMYKKATRDGKAAAGRLEDQPEEPKLRRLIVKQCHLRGASPDHERNPGWHPGYP